MKRSRPWRIAIVGAGKVGCVLGRALADRGDRIVAVVSRTSASARRGGRFLRCRTVSTSPAAIPQETDLILLTTPHAAVEGVAAALAKRSDLRLRGMAVCHASGMLTAKALEPLRRRGAEVFSFHPLQTFPRDFPPSAMLGSVRGIFYGVDGGPRALRTAARLARRLGGHTVRVPPARRVLYHAACVVASNHLTALLGVLERMSAALGGKRFSTVFEPIMQATIRNAARTSPARSLSGPVARGGVETVDAHFTAVRRSVPEAVPYFAALTLETIRLARSGGSIDDRQAGRMIRLVLSHLRAYSGKKGPA